MQQHHKISTKDLREEILTLLEEYADSRNRRTLWRNPAAKTTPKKVRKPKLTIVTNTIAAVRKSRTPNELLSALIYASTAQHVAISKHLTRGSPEQVRGGKLQDTLKQAIRLLNGRHRNLFREFSSALTTKYSRYIPCADTTKAEWLRFAHNIRTADDQTFRAYLKSNPYYADEANEIPSYIVSAFLLNKGFSRSHSDYLSYYAKMDGLWGCLVETTALIKQKMTRSNILLRGEKHTYTIMASDESTSKITAISSYDSCIDSTRGTPRTYDLAKPLQIETIITIELETVPSSEIPSFSDANLSLDSRIINHEDFPVAQVRPLLCSFELAITEKDIANLSPAPEDHDDSPQSSCDLSGSYTPSEHLHPTAEEESNASDEEPQVERNLFGFG